MRSYVIIVLFLLSLSVHAQRQVVVKNLVLEADLTDFFLPSKAFRQSPSSLENAYPKGKYSQNPYFSWLDKNKTRALFKSTPATGVKLKLTLLNKTVPIDEAIIDFRNNRYYGCTISVFNKGDSKSLSAEEFKKRNADLARAINSALNTRPKKRTGDLEKGILSSGYTWQSEKGMAVLDFNLEAPEKIEFVRMRVAHPKARAPYLNALHDSLHTTIRPETLLENLKKSGTSVYIENIPMVDQGSKDYCVVASVQRIFEYYQIPCDMHQLAQLVGTDTNAGTDTVKASAQIAKIDHFFNTHYTLVGVKQPDGFFYEVEGQYLGKKVQQETLMTAITTTVDKGIPVLWGLELGKHPETPPLKNQTSGGHMRLITGYDLEKRIIYFSDSWGTGHERKQMNLDDAMKVTTGIFTLVPTFTENQ